MSTPTTDGLKQEIDQGRMRVGNEVQLATGLPATAGSLPYVDSSSKLAATAVTASTPVYIDSNKIPQTGAVPFAYAFAAAATTVSVLDITGTSTLSADEIMHNTLVDGTGVTTFTKTGFIQVNVTDSGGNITNGKHYIQIGTLS